MILKKQKKTITFLLLITSQLIMAVNDTIKRVDRVIPKNFKEQYTDEDYIYAAQEPGFLLTLKTWFRELIFFILHNLGIGMSSNIFRYLKLIFYFLIFGVAVYIVARMFFYKEGSWIFRNHKNQNHLTYQNEVEIIEMANFKELIEKATLQEDYRLAIKYGYFWVLQKFAENNIIELSNLKTNADYQLEIENTTYKDSFKTISYYYNYIWYGEFPIDKEAYKKVEAIYTELLNNIKA